MKPLEHLRYSPEFLKEVLTKTKTIALVGASANTARDSNEVMQYLQKRGYRVIPVNPGLAGQQLLGETVYATLKDIPEKIDLVDVFRNSLPPDLCVTKPSPLVQNTSGCNWASPMKTVPHAPRPLASK